MTYTLRNKLYFDTITSSPSLLSVLHCCVCSLTALHRYHSDFYHQFYYHYYYHYYHYYCHHYHCCVAIILITISITIPTTSGTKKRRGKEKNRKREKTHTEKLSSFERQLHCDSRTAKSFYRPADLWTVTRSSHRGRLLIAAVIG